MPRQARRLRRGRSRGTGGSNRGARDRRGATRAPHFGVFTSLRIRKPLQISLTVDSSINCFPPPAFKNPAMRAQGCPQSKKSSTTRQRIAAPNFRTDYCPLHYFERALSDSPGACCSSERIQGDVVGESHILKEEVAGEGPRTESGVPGWAEWRSSKISRGSDLVRTRFWVELNSVFPNPTHSRIPTKKTDFPSSIPDLPKI